jgi:hypothetical protein
MFSFFLCLYIVTASHKTFKDSTALVGLGLLYKVPRSHSFRHTTLSRISLDERSARRRDLYPTTHNTHNGQTSMSPAGFELAIPVSERTQTNALNRAVTGIGSLSQVSQDISLCKCYTCVLHVRQMRIP